MDHLLSHLVFHMYYDCFKDLNFADDMLITKIAKFMSLESLYAYGIILSPIQETLTTGDM